MYTKVSIPKKTGAGSPGAPKAKKPTLLVVDMNDIETFPERDANNVKITTNLALKAGAVAQAVYCTPSTIKRNDESEGDPDAEGFIQNVSGEHPGTALEISEFIQNNIGRDLVVLSQGLTPDSIRLHGMPGVPMKLQVTDQDDNTADKATLVFKSVQRCQYRSAHYYGTLPALAPEAEDSGSSGDGI